MKGFQIDRLAAAIAESERVMQHNLNTHLYADYEFGAHQQKPNLIQAFLTKFRVSIGNAIGSLADKIRGHSLDDY